VRLVPLQKETQISVVIASELMLEENGRALGEPGSVKHPAYVKGVKSVQKGPAGVPFRRVTRALVP
jgi:hypothetical protein